MDKKFTSLESLQFALWNAYKDAYGFRPRHLTQAEWDNAEYLTKILGQCERAIIAEINLGN